MLSSTSTWCTDKSGTSRSSALDNVQLCNKAGSLSFFTNMGHYSGKDFCA